MDGSGYEFLDGLSECISLCRRLDEKLDRDAEEIPAFLKGDVLNAYEQSVRTVQKNVRDLKNDLLELQSELSLGQ